MSQNELSTRGATWMRTLAGGTRVACHLVADEEELVVKERELV